MSYVIPSDTHAAGDTGHIADHNNISDTLAALGNSPLDLYTEPAGVTARTFPRGICTAGSTAVTSGTLYATIIGMHQNTVVNNLSFATKGTALTGLAHGWYVLMDSGLVVRAVTADQTSGTWLSVANTVYTLPVTAAYTTSYSGYYYIGVMVSATGAPNFSSPGATTAGLNAAVPVLCGTSSTAQTTPPAVGTAMTALTSAASFLMYGYTS